MLRKSARLAIVLGCSGTQWAQVIHLLGIAEFGSDWVLSATQITVRRKSALSVENAFMFLCSLYVSRNRNCDQELRELRYVNCYCYCFHYFEQ